MKNLINEIIAREAALKLKEEETARKSALKVDSLRALAKQVEGWMSPLIEKGYLSIEGDYNFRKEYSLHLPEGDLYIGFTTDLKDDNILVEFSFYSVDRGSLTLQQLGSFSPVPIFGIVKSSIPTNDLKLGVTEFTKEIFENYLLIVISRLQDKLLLA